MKTMVSQIGSDEPLFTLNRTRTVRPSSWLIAFLLFGTIGGAAYFASRSEPPKLAPPESQGPTTPGPVPTAPLPTPQPTPAPPLTEGPSATTAPATPDDRSVDTLIQRSRAASERGEQEAALADAEAAIALAPDNAGALLAQGRALFHLKRLDEAQRPLLRSIDVDPTDAEARNLLGMLYLEQGHDREALDEFKEAAILAPDDESIRGNLERARERVAAETAAEPPAGPTSN